MTTKTTEPAPSTETPQTSGGCCGGKAKAAPEPESRETASGAKAGTKASGCGCGN